MTTSIPSSPGFMNTLLSLISSPYGKNSAAKMQSKQNSHGGSNESVTINGPINGPVNVSNGGNTISGQGNVQVNNTTNNFSMASKGDLTSDRNNDDDDKGNTEKEKEKVGKITPMPKTNEYNEDNQGNVIVPNELIPMEKKKINVEHCQLYFDFYAGFHRHPKCLEEVKKLVMEQKGREDKGIVHVAKTNDRILNFVLILTTIYEELIGLGRQLFKEEVCKNFGKMGIKVGTQPPKNFDQCMTVLGSECLRQQKYPTFPVVLAYRCVHSVKAQPGDAFYPRFFRQLEQFGRKNYFIFDESVKGTTKREPIVSHNIIKIAKLGFSDPKKACQEREKSLYGMSIRQQRVKNIEHDAMVIPMSKEEKKDGGYQSNDGGNRTDQGPFFFIHSKKRLFGEFLATQGNDVLERLFRKSDDERTFLQAAAIGAAIGLDRQGFLNRAAEAYDSLFGVFTAAPPSHDDVTLGDIDSALIADWSANEGAYAVDNEVFDAVDSFFGHNREPTNTQGTVKQQQWPNPQVQATAHDAAMMMQNQQPQVSAPSRHHHGRPDAAMTQYQQPQYWYHDASMMMQNQQPQVSAPSNHHHGPTNAQGTVLLNQQGGSYNAAMNQQPYCTLTGESLLPQHGAKDGASHNAAQHPLQPVPPELDKGAAALAQPQGAKDGASHNAAQHPLQPVPPELDKGAAALAQPQATANVSEMQTDTLHPGCAKDTTPQVVAQSREALFLDLLRETGVNTADAAQGSSTAMIGGPWLPELDKGAAALAQPQATANVSEMQTDTLHPGCAKDTTPAMIGGPKDPITDKATNTKALPESGKKRSNDPITDKATNTSQAPKAGKKRSNNVLVSFCCFVIGFYQHLTRMQYGFVIHYIDIEKTSSKASTNA